MIEQVSFPPAHDVAPRGSEPDLRRRHHPIQHMISSGNSARSRTVSKSSTSSSTRSAFGVTEPSKRRAPPLDGGDLYERSKSEYSSASSYAPLSTPDINSLWSPTTRDFLGLEDIFWAGDDELLASLEDDLNNLSLAVATAEEGRDVRVEGNGRSLQEIEPLLSANTTHMILTGCREPSILDFLVRKLPLVAPSLLVLDISNTGLEELPDSLGQCNHLEELNLSGNPILPAPAGNMDVLARLDSSLRLLLIDNCGLTMLPGSLIYLRQLRMLSVCSNHLTHLPAWLHRLTNLDRLLLVNNPFGGVWQNVCEPFTASTSSPSARQKRASTISSVAVSSSSEGVHFKNPWSAKEDEIEELLEPNTAPAAMDSAAEFSTAAARTRTLRPLMRRMMSSGDVKTLAETKGQHKAAAGTEPDSKWYTIRRKMVKKPSIPAMDVSLAHTRLEHGAHATVKVSKAVPARPQTASGAMPPVRKSSLGAQAALRQDPSPSSKAETGDGSPTLGTVAGDKRQPTAIRSKRASFLPFGAHPTALDGVLCDDNTSIYSSKQDDANNRRNVRSLLQYLEDLSDLNPVQRRMSSVLSLAQSHLSDISTSSVDISRSGSETTSPASSGPSTDDEDCFTSSARSKKNVDDVTDYAQPAKAKDDPHRRAHIVSEIITTEETYVKTLKEMVDIYVLPSSMLDANRQPVIPAAEQRHVFSNVEGIFRFHKDAFLPALRAAAQPLIMQERLNLDNANDMQRFSLATAMVSEQVAQTFERHAAFFRMYTSYVNNVDAAQRRVAQWLASPPGSQTLRGGVGLRRESHTSIEGQTAQPSALQPKERKRIRAFLHRARMDPHHSQLSFEAYLHLPVQRIPRYRLLFEDLARVCPPERLSDGRSILNALSSISSVAAMMNESKRQSEMDQKLLQWQDKIQGHWPSPLVQPHRKLIHDGPLTLKRIVSRVPSFCVPRRAILGDAATLDGVEDVAMLQIADATRADDERQSSRMMLEAGMLQIHHLEQQAVLRNVELILCNDITVVVERSRTGSVDLFAVLRIAGPARIINQTTVRVVDPKHILYLSASSAREAQTWQRAMTTAHRSAGTFSQF